MAGSSLALRPRRGAGRVHGPAPEPRRCDGSVLARPQDHGAIGQGQRERSRLRPAMEPCLVLPASLPASARRCRSACRRPAPRPTALVRVHLREQRRAGRSDRRVDGHSNEVVTRTIYTHLFKEDTTRHEDTLSDAFAGGWGTTSSVCHGPTDFVGDDRAGGDVTRAWIDTLSDLMRCLGRVRV